MHQQFVLKTAADFVGGKALIVVPQSNRLFQNLPRMKSTAATLSRLSSSCSFRGEFCQKAHFVRIDVAESAHDSLIKQSRFDGFRNLLESLMEHFRSQFIIERIMADFIQRGMR